MASFVIYLLVVIVLDWCGCLGFADCGFMITLVLIVCWFEELVVGF